MAAHRRPSDALAAGTLRLHCEALQALCARVDSLSAAVAEAANKAAAKEDAKKAGPEAKEPPAEAKGGDVGGAPVGLPSPVFPTDPFGAPRLLRLRGGNGLPIRPPSSSSLASPLGRVRNGAAAGGDVSH